MDASEVHEDHDMHFTAALLSVFEQAIDKVCYIINANFLNYRGCI